MSALKLGLDQTNSQQRDQKISQIMILADHPFLMESEYWYLALELNRMSAWEPLTRILSKAITQYPKDFNILDINAGYLEQKELFSQAIPFRERQIAIEPRHPRVWLSYAYDLNAAGRKTEAGLAFGKVVRFKEFLDPKIISQLSEIAKELGVSYSG